MPVSKQLLEAGLTSITIMDKQSGAVYTLPLSFAESLPGGMSVNVESMGQITCPACKASLELLAGLWQRSHNSKISGSTPTPAFESGTPEWSLAFTETEQYEINSPTLSLTLTDQQMSSLRQLLGSLNRPFLESALEALSDYAKTFPGVRFSSKSTIAWYFSSHTTAALHLTFSLYEKLLASLFHIHPTPSSSSGG